MIGLDGTGQLVRPQHYPPSVPIRSLSMPAAPLNGDDMSIHHRWESVGYSIPEPPPTHDVLS